MKFFWFAILGLFVSSCASTPAPLFRNPQFNWPVRKGRITQGFKSGSRKHQGLDISGARNSPIYAAAGGRVLYVGQGFSGYGKLIIIEHDGDRWATFYAHLNDFKVREGSFVKKGQLIGLMGRTGRATGVHLHFEIRHNLSPVDPRPYMTRQTASLN